MPCDAATFGGVVPRPMTRTRAVSTASTIPLWSKARQVCCGAFGVAVDKEQRINDNRRGAARGVNSVGLITAACRARNPARAPARRAVDIVENMKSASCGVVGKGEMNQLYGGGRQS